MKFILVLSGLLLSQNALAQGRDMAWPKTFSGQPDFEFSRTEIVKEALQQAKEEGAPPPEVGSLDELLAAQASFTPLQLEVPVDPRAEELPVNTDAVSALIAPTAEVALPAVAEEELLDVSAFKVVLEGAAANAVRKARVNPKKYNFKADLARLRLETVATSPNKFAVINGRKYQPGDRLHITVPVQVSSADIEAALLAHMPPKDALDTERYAQYEAVRAEVLNDVNAQLKAGGMRRGQRLAVQVVGIESRRVLLQVGGKDYELEIKYRL